MSSRNVVNVVVVVLVILVVAGTAWWKTTRRTEPPAAAPAPAAPAVASSQPSARKPAPASAPAHARAASAPAATQPASQPASAPAARLPRLLDLGADKCLACRKLAPILEALREEYQGRLVVEFCDVWKDPAPAKKYGIRLIPTQILFDRDGREVWRHEGFISKEELQALIAQKVGVK